MKMDLVIYSDGSQTRHDGKSYTGWCFSIRERGISRKVLLLKESTLGHLYVCLHNTSGARRRWPQRDAARIIPGYISSFPCRRR